MCGFSLRFGDEFAILDYRVDFCTVIRALIYLFYKAQTLYTLLCISILPYRTVIPRVKDILILFRL